MGGSRVWSIASGLIRDRDFGLDCSLGRQAIALASGLMEITYDTGAKVILQGPVTYEVESTGGGFLSARQADGQVGERTINAKR